MKSLASPLMNKSGSAGASTETQNIFSVNQRTYQRKFAPVVERSSLQGSPEPCSALVRGRFYKI
jgi:hypothetical protein